MIACRTSRQPTPGSRLGCSRTPPAFVHDLTIVLLKSGVTNAAFVVTKERYTPAESVDYTWFLRSDGKSTFDARDPACSTGTVSSVKRVAFGPFDIDWSSAGSTGGYLYYPERYWSVHLPWGKYWTIEIPGGPWMAVTTELDITKVDANDPRWRFRRHRQTILPHKNGG